MLQWGCTRRDVLAWLRRHGTDAVTTIVVADGTGV